jgi:nucleoside-diphosphate-sugar epimerase
MNIVIIGGTRFMGPSIVQSLHAAGHKVTIFHRGSTRIELPEGVNEILGDLNQLTERADVLRRQKADVVLNMMAATEEQARQFMEVFSGFAGRVVVISSQDVYRAFGRVNGTEGGEIDPAPLSEESPLRENLYPHRDIPGGESAEYDKILVERVVMNSPELPATLLRLPAVYGPRDFQHRMFIYLKRMLDGRPAILLEEDVANWRWTHGYVENVVDAIILAISNERASGRIYNVGEPFALSMAERVAQIAQAAEWHGRVVTLPTEQVPEKMRWGINATQNVVADSSRIRHELGYSERIDLTEAFRRTIAWERANPPEKIDPEMFDYETEDRALARAENS